MSETSQNPNAWIGCDLDGTLAHYDGWKGPEHIGEPVPVMLLRVKNWISEGKTVKIVTARAADAEQHPLIQEWLVKHGLPALEITNHKDYGMSSLWDDRAVGVIPNMGIPHEMMPAFALHEVCKAVGITPENGDGYANAAKHVTRYVHRTAANLLAARSERDEYRAVLESVADALRYNTAADTDRATRLIARTLSKYAQPSTDSTPPQRPQ